MTEHQHITFYNNSQARSSTINAVFGTEELISDQSRGVAMGGGRLFTATDKNIAIIEYLKRLPSAARVRLLSADC